MQPIECVDAEVTLRYDQLFRVFRAGYSNSFFHDVSYLGVPDTEREWPGGHLQHVRLEYLMEQLGCTWEHLPPVDSADQYRHQRVIGLDQSFYLTPVAFLDGKEYRFRLVKPVLTFGVSPRLLTAERAEGANLAAGDLPAQLARVQTEFLEQLVALGVPGVDERHVSFLFRGQAQEIRLVMVGERTVPFKVEDGAVRVLEDEMVAYNN